jgi:hypothetical protein
MSLRAKQSRFARLVPRLIDKAHELGFEVTLGDAYRDPKVHGELGVRKSYSHPRSAHKVRLAIDLNLFADTDGDGDVDFISTTERHRPLGEWWEKQDPDARWGGRFNDGNHYSFEHEGVK